MGEVTDVTCGDSGCSVEGPENIGMGWASLTYIFAQRWPKTSLVLFPGMGEVTDVTCGDSGCSMEGPENMACDPITVRSDDPDYGGKKDCLMFVRTQEVTQDDCRVGESINTDADLMLAQRRRLWANIKSASVQSCQIFTNVVLALNLIGAHMVQMVHAKRPIHQSLAVMYIYTDCQYVDHSAFLQGDA